MIGEVPITIWASPFVLSQNTPKGDEWVEEEWLSNIVDFKWVLVKLYSLTYSIFNLHFVL